MIEKEYPTTSFGKVKMGGRFGEYPPVLILSIFHPNDMVVLDVNKGLIDKEKACERIALAQEFSDDYKVPFFLAILSEYASDSYLEFLSDAFDGVIILDGFVQAKLQALPLVSELGLEDRVIYSSVGRLTEDYEWAALKNSNLKSAFVQLSGHSSSSKYLDIKELIAFIHQEVGFEKVLLDCGTMGLESMGEAFELFFMLKKTYPYPTGLVPANIRDFERKVGTFGSKIMEIENEVLYSTVNTLACLFGDFSYFGPLAWAGTAFKSAAVTYEVKKNLRFDFLDL